MLCHLCIYEFNFSSYMFLIIEFCAIYMYVIDLVKFDIEIETV